MVVVRLGGERREEGWSMALSRRDSLVGVEKEDVLRGAHACRGPDVVGVRGLCKSGSRLGNGGSSELSSASTCI